MGIDHDAADNKDESEQAKTLVIEPLDDGATLEIEREIEPPRKKRRFGWLIAIVVVAAVLVVGFFVGDHFARQYATNLVRDRIIEVLKLDKNTEVAVGLGSGSILLQAIGGSVNDVTVDIPELELGEISAGASVTAAGVPLDTSRPVDKLGITVTVTEEQAQKLKTFLSGIDLTSIELGDGVISVGTEFDVLGLLKVPVSVDLAPSATKGGIAFDPQTIVLDGNPISVQDLRANPLVSALAGQLLASQTFCVAEYLPQALTLTDVDVVGETLVLKINGDGAALSGAGDPGDGCVLVGGSQPPSQLFVRQRRYDREVSDPGHVVAGKRPARGWFIADGCGARTGSIACVGDEFMDRVDYQFSFSLD